MEEYQELLDLEFAVDECAPADATTIQEDIARFKPDATIVPQPEEGIEDDDVAVRNALVGGSDDGQSGSER